MGQTHKWVQNTRSLLKTTFAFNKIYGFWPVKLFSERRKLISTIAICYMYTCVCTYVCSCVYMYCVCTWMHTCTEARSWVDGVFLVCFAFYYLRQGLSLVLNSPRRPGLSVGRHQPSSLHCNHRCWLFTGSRRQSSCLRAGVGWIWFAESSSKGNFILFFVFWGRISL